MNGVVAAQPAVAGLLLDDVIQCKVPVTSQTVSLPRCLAGPSARRSEADQRADVCTTWLTVSTRDRANLCSNFERNTTEVVKIAVT